MDLIHVLSPVQHHGASSNGTTPGSSKTTNTNDVHSSQTSEHWAYGEQWQVNAAQLAKAVDHVNNGKLANSTTKVEFEYDAKSQRYWVNVVDKTSGKVISEVPPEAVRKIVD